MLTGGDRIHLWQYKVLEEGQVQATGQNEDKATSGENEDEAIMGGEN
jgi:hypothetical protein